MTPTTPQASAHRSRPGGMCLAGSHAAATYVGRVGGLAVALGLGAAVITGWGGVAHADTPGATASDTTAADSGATQPDAPSDRSTVSTGPGASTTAAGSTGTPASTTTAAAGSEVRSATPGVVVATGGRNETSTEAGRTAPESVETGPTSLTPPTVTTEPEPDAIDSIGPEVTSEPDAGVTLGAQHAPDESESSAQPSANGAEPTTPDPSSAVLAAAVVSDVAPTPSTATDVGAPEETTVSATPTLSSTASVPGQAADLAVPSAPIGAPVSTDGAVGVVSTVISAVLSPFAAVTTPGAPVEPAAAWALLAVARRELGGVPVGQSPTVDSVAIPTIAALVTDPSARLAEPSAATAAFNAAASEAMFTGQPSLVNQVFVAALRLAKPVLSLVGIDLSGSSMRIPFLTDGIPPFFLTFGLDVQSDVVDGMQVWTLAPANPSDKVVVAVHGGGFIGEASIFHWLTYTALVRDTGATVIVPNYPVANEAGTGGTAATVVPVMADFIAAQVAQYGVENVSVLGDSAGGTIALAATQELARRCGGDQACLDEQLPGRLVLIAPVLDLSMTNPDIQLVDDPLLNFESSQRNGRLWAAGLGTPEDPDGTKNPLASPLFGSLEDLPPITVYAGSLDLRTPDVLVLQQQAASTPGADFTFELRNGQIHDWIIFAFLPDAVAERPNIYRDLGLIEDEV